jgi:pyruvate/2-oxoglutarate dehydrogenase complex dihydrolipoamide dehydrogenase (E3) component
MSKLIFHSETRQLPGVHIIGEGASELIHIGQAVLLHRDGIQLPDLGRMLQSGIVRRHQPAQRI